MTDHCISIKKKELVDLVKALNNCTVNNINKFETPVNCLYNLNKALIVGVDPYAKTFAVIDQQTKQEVVVALHELMCNFQKREKPAHQGDKLKDLSAIIVSPTNNFTSFDIDTSVHENPVGSRTPDVAQPMLSINGGNVVDISKYTNNAIMNQLSDYFSASTSIEEGLCE